LFAWTLLAGISMTVFAEPGPVEMLQATTEQVLALVRQDPDVLEDPLRLRVIANEIVLPHVDFPALSRWVLGKHWRQATPQQRAAFIDAFRELLLGTYLRSVSRYRDNAISFRPLAEAPATDRVAINAEITQPGAPVVHAVFKLHRPAGKWLIYDVAVEGVSLVATHRSSFYREISRSGLDGLIDRMQAHNADTAAPAAGTGGVAVP
jgi:phospholipid transport system substrate-binding protein